MAKNIILTEEKFHCVLYLKFPVDKLKNVKEFIEDLNTFYKKISFKIEAAYINDEIDSDFFAVYTIHSIFLNRWIIERNGFIQKFEGNFYPTWIDYQGRIHGGYNGTLR